jgi:PAS domain S-box-containing protein
VSTVRRSRAIAARLLSSNFSPIDGPLVREGLWRRAWPFVLAGVAARVMLWLPGSDITDRWALYTSAGCSLTLVAIAVFAPWRRLPLWTQGLVPLAFLGVIALLRESTGGVGGYSVLVMLPVLWLALYGTLWQLVTSIFLSVCVFVVPILTIGGPTYPASQLGRILLWPITAAIVGGTTYRLVAAERARTAFVSSVLSAATQQSIIATNPDGIITVFNTGAERMFGYSAKEMIGVSTPVVLHDADEVAERAAELGVPPGFDVFTSRARQGEPETHEWTYVRRDGSRLQVSLSVTPIHDDTGELRGFIKIGTDVTERRAAERLKDDFVALVSHELRTPLSSIIGYLEVIFDDETGPLTPRQQRFLEVVDRNARRQLRLVSDLLFVSQVDAGRVRLDIDEVDLTGLAKAAIEAAQPRAKAAGVTLQLAADDATVLRGDADRLGQIFDNLLTNAIKFSPAGRQVDVRLSSTADAVEVQVADWGIGIAEDDQQRLFTRFFRATTATDRAIPGIGLGLTIVKAIVDAHRGTVSVSSVEGRGTTFTVSLPRSDAAGPIS